MVNYINAFIFGIYPYIALAIFLFGSLLRFDREQYTWKSDSSQLLYRGPLRIGNILFHIGIIGLFFTHLVGLLTPVIVWDSIGITHTFKQMMAIIGGAILGSCTLIGLLILLYRRFTNERIWAATRTGDKILLVWILITLLLGLSSIFVSVHHRDGYEMLQLMTWAQYVISFRGDAAAIVAKSPLIFKVHVFMGMTLFVIFPFTRLVHVWSGFGSVAYLTRAWQLIRPR